MRAVFIVLSLIEFALCATNAQSKRVLSGDELRAYAIAYKAFNATYLAKYLRHYRVELTKNNKVFLIAFFPEHGEIVTERGAVADSISIAEHPGLGVTYFIDRNDFRLLKERFERD
jgi:hypothetical protein